VDWESIGIDSLIKKIGRKVLSPDDDSDEFLCHLELLAVHKTEMMRCCCTAVRGALFLSAAQGARDHLRIAGEGWIDAFVSPLISIQYPSFLPLSPSKEEEEEQRCM